MRPLGCIKVKHFDAWDDFEFTPPFQSRNCNLHWEKLQPFPPLWENLGFRFRVFANHRRIDPLDINNSSFLENPKHVCFFCERGHLCKLSQRCFFLYICNQWRVVDEIFLVWKKLVVYLKGRWIKKSCEKQTFFWHRQLFYPNKPGILKPTSFFRWMFGVKFFQIPSIQIWTPSSNRVRTDRL